MSYVEVPESFIDVDDPGRSSDWKQFTRNQVDHEARIVALEDPSIRVATHFGTLIRDLHYVVSGATTLDTDEWHFATTGVGRMEQRLWLGADEHVMRIEVPSASVSAGRVTGKTGFYFDNRVKPITFHARVKISDSSGAGFTKFEIGLGGSTASGLVAAGTEPANGVFLRKDSGTQWRFRAANGGATTDGTAWVHGLDNTWFDVDLEWVAASKTCTCKVNGTVRATFTQADNIPAAKVVYALAGGTIAATGKFLNIDEIEASAGGVIVDVP